MDTNLVMIDPTHDGVLEDVAKKRIRPGEEALMLAVAEKRHGRFPGICQRSSREGATIIQRSRGMVSRKGF
jgi:hypothetical protein